jgi:hypothetical protein
MFTRIWLGGVILLGSPVVVLVLVDLVKGRVEEGLWFSLLVIVLLWKRRRAIHPGISAEDFGCKNREPNQGHY